MKPEAQQIAIAEACKIQTQYFRFQHDYHDNQRIWSSRHTTRQEAEDVKVSRFSKYGRPSEVEQYTDLSRVPDYLNDLNAMHEAEKLFVKDHVKTADFYAHLQTATHRIDPFSCPTWHASATQRAEAFLRTLNLWTE